MDDSSLPSKPLCLRDDALAVLMRLREAGHVAYFAGGCVRDLLLGIEPKDYDVATDAPPQRVRALFRNTQAVGQAFGVILVRLGRSTVEVATFRSDGRYLDGRHPQSIRFASAEEDARRRDFTINGLFLDPLNDQVIDYVDGQRDLTGRVLRAIGQPEQRFEEDHLRLLRAVRFAARFNLTIEPATAQAIRHHAPQLARISPERIGEELRLILTPPSRWAAWRMLWDYALVHVIFRFLDPLSPRPLGGEAGPRSGTGEGGGSGKGHFLAEEPAAADGTQSNQSLFLKLNPPRPIPFPLALAAGAFCYQWDRLGSAADPRPLLHRGAVSSARRALRKALKISNDESDRLAAILESAGSLLRDIPPTVAERKRFMASPWSSDTRLFLDALEKSGWFKERIKSLRDEFTALETIECAPPPLIDGDDLRAAGLEPGPIFKKILHEVYDAQLENRLATREQAMSLAMELVR
jgi:poly(A) polymerase